MQEIKINNQVDKDSSKSSNIIGSLYKKYKFKILISIIFTILAVIPSYLIIKYLDKILELFKVGTLSEIFSQLRYCQIIVPFIFPFIISLFVTILLSRFNLNKHKTLKILLKIVLYIFTYVLLLAFCTLFSKSNGILFIDILISLINNLGGLGL